MPILFLPCRCLRVGQLHDPRRWSAPKCSKNIRPTNILLLACHACLAFMGEGGQCEWSGNDVLLFFAPLTTIPLLPSAPIHRVAHLGSWLAFCTRLLTLGCCNIAGSNRVPLDEGNPAKFPSAKADHTATMQLCCRVEKAVAVDIHVEEAAKVHRQFVAGEYTSVLCAAWMRQKDKALTATRM